MSLILLRRCKYSDRFVSVDGLFKGEYSLNELMSAFPQSYLLVINDDTEYHFVRVLNRRKIKEAFDIDGQNQFHCEQCRSKNIVSRKFCRKCGYENKYWEVVKYLDDSIFKASELKNYVLYDFWQETPEYA